MRRRWRELSPATTPEARWDHGLVWDDANDEIVMYGGDSFDTPAISAKTYLWDGVDWSLQSPSTTPPNRAGFGFCFHEQEGYVLRYAGIDNSIVPHNDTWKWDGADWTDLAPSTSPDVGAGGGRQRPAMASFGSAYTLMFGGSDTIVTLKTTTWKFDSGNWTQLFPSTTPSGRFGHCMGYDRVSGTIIMHGGEPTTTETYEWDGTDWTLLSPTTTPSNLSVMTMHWHPGLERLVMFGGLSFADGGDTTNDVWSWNRNSGDWEVITVCSTASEPSKRYQPRWDYDYTMGKTLMFGGVLSGFVTRLDDTWAWGDRCHRHQVIRSHI